MNARRRWIAASAAWPALAWTDAVFAQAKAPVVIGWLDIAAPGRNGLLNAFIEGMAALGWKLGTSYVLEERHADGRAERLPALAQELAARNLPVIAAWPSAAAGAATRAAPTTPVVLVNGDPLVARLVKSLARPDGMVTGISNVSAETLQKVVEISVEAVPKLQRLGFLVDSSNPGGDNTARARRVAERMRVEAVVAHASKPENIEAAMEQFAKGKVQAVVIMPSAWFVTQLPTIVQAATARRWPVVGTLPGIVTQGGLLSYSADALVLARRSAHYVDRILKGAKPGDLPIEQPTAFDLVLNLKTAKALGIVIPPSVRVRATRVIE